MQGIIQQGLKQIESSSSWAGTRKISWKFCRSKKDHGSRAEIMDRSEEEFVSWQQSPCRLWERAHCSAIRLLLTILWRGNQGGEQLGLKKTIPSSFIETVLNAGVFRRNSTVADAGYKNLNWFREGLPEWIKKGYPTTEGNNRRANNHVLGGAEKPSNFAYEKGIKETILILTLSLFISLIYTAASPTGVVLLKKAFRITVSDMPLSRRSNATGLRRTNGNDLVPFIISALSLADLPHIRLAKISDPIRFMLTLREFRLFPEIIIPFTAIYIPWLEFISAFHTGRDHAQDCVPDSLLSHRVFHLPLHQ